MTLEDYLSLITSEYRGKKVFEDTLSLDLSPQIQIQNLLLSMIPKFDLNQAVGDQLDVIGQWVGVSRHISIPLSGIFFTWDGPFDLGWDYGSWQPDNAPVDITSLPDDAYLTLIKAKIAANHWDGTTDGAYSIWDALFPTTTILINDHQDMTYDLAIIGGVIDSLTLALLTGGYLPLRPEGVLINEYLVSTDSNPAFCWDLEEVLQKGWDEGSWLREIPA